MSQISDIGSTLFALGGLLLQLCLGGVGILLLFPKTRKVILFVTHKRTYRIAGLFAIAGFAGSVFYSEIVGFIPCVLCWAQRIMLLAVFILIGLCIWGKKRKIFAVAVLVASLAGATVGVFQHFMQQGVVPDGACDALSGSVSCSQLLVNEMGYMTIPLMSSTIFAVIALCFVIDLLAKHGKKPFFEMVVNTWNISPTPEYRGFRCGACQRELMKAWHHVQKSKKMLCPVHLCDDCQRMYLKGSGEELVGNRAQGSVPEKTGEYASVLRDMLREAARKIVFRKTKEMRAFSCDGCGEIVKEAWHIWDTQDGRLVEVHMCNQCGSKGGLVLHL